MNSLSQFSELELQGWQDRAADYEATTHRMTGSTIPKLIAATRAAAGDRVLDVCCGTGAVAQQLVADGAVVCGVDLAPAMVAAAEVNVPEADFCQADAQDLPYELGSFDVVVSNFGHYHLPDPDTAISEAARVLRAGGRYGFTTWVGPDQSPGFRLIFETILNNVDPEVTLPPAPDAFRLANEATAKTVLVSAGFTDIRIETFASTITCAPDDFVAFLKAATVRATLVLKAQPEMVRLRIECLLRDRIEAFVRDGRVVLPVPNRIITATRISFDGTGCDN